MKEVGSTKETALKTLGHNQAFLLEHWRFHFAEINKTYLHTNTFYCAYINRCTDLYDISTQTSKSLNLDFTLTIGHNIILPVITFQ
jgi:hypothetical protein